MWWVGAVVLTVLVVGLIWLWLRAMQRRLALPALPPLPQRIAEKALEALRQQAADLKPEVFAARLTDIIKTFLHRQTGVLARFATSPEILGDRISPDRPPPPPVISAFRKVLTDADALKYGPVHDRKVQTDALIDSALEAVRIASTPRKPPVPPPLPPSTSTKTVTPAAEPPSSLLPVSASSEKS